MQTTKGLQLICTVLMAVMPWIAPAAGWAQWDGQKIAQVRIEGLAEQQPGPIESRLQTKVGGVYRSVDVRQDVAQLAKIMEKATVQVKPAEDGQVCVVFGVTEYPLLDQVQIIGNQKMKTARIETLAGLKAGDSLSQALRQRIERSIRNEYKVLGLPQARVSLSLIAKGNGHADLQILIEEGKRILVKDVMIEGNQVFSSVRLKANMETKGSVLFIKNYYDEQTFAEDLNTLRDFYAAHGYFSAQVQRGLFTEEPFKGEACISPRIEINEGQRYTLGHVEVLGARLFDQSELLEPFEPLLGKPFDGKAFAGALKKLQDLYLNLGLLTTQIMPRYEHDPVAQELNVTLQIEEAERIHVGRVRLVRPPLPPEDEEGTGLRAWYETMAPPVEDEVIARELLLAPGDVYNKKLEQDTIRRINRLNVFNEKTLRAYNQPTEQAGVHDMIIEAEDAVTGALSGGVGYGDDLGAFVFGQFNENNVGGQADVLSLNALLGTRSQSATLSYLNRQLGETNDTLLSKLYINQYHRPGYRVQLAGGSTEWGHPLSNDWTTYLRARIEAVKTRGDDNDTEENLDETYAVATLRWRFEQDTRTPLYSRTREGYLQDYSLEMGYAGAFITRLEGMRDQYWRLSEELTWRTKALAAMMPYDRSLVPVNERYFLGGAGDLRGFKFRGVGYKDKKDDSVPIGGAAKFSLQNELQFPIYDPVSGVAFFDVGTLGRTPVNWEVPRASTGVGLRFDMNHVQVNLDLAAPLLKQSEDDTRFFHFSLKSQF